jgi:hypothetical protein
MQYNILFHKHQSLLIEWLVTVARDRREESSCNCFTFNWKQMFSISFQLCAFNVK